MTCGVESAKPYLVGCYDDQTDSSLEWEGSGDAPVSIEGWLDAPLHDLRLLMPLMVALRDNLKLMDDVSLRHVIGTARNVDDVPTTVFLTSVVVKVAWANDAFWVRIDRMGTPRTPVGPRAFVKDGRDVADWLEPRGFTCTDDDLGDGWADVACVTPKNIVAIRHHDGRITSAWAGWMVPAGRGAVLDLVRQLVGKKAAAAWRPATGSPASVHGVDGFVIRCGQDSTWSYCVAVPLAWGL